MKNNIKYPLFILLEILLFTGVVVLIVKIININNGKIKGAQTITRINKNDIIFSSDSGKLKFFYEPKSNTTKTYKPGWLGYTANNTINSDALNERINYTTEKADGVYRIITLGDSFTYGYYVNTTDNYSEVLEDLLNQQLICPQIKKFEVINLGVYGYDVEYEVERYKKRGVKYDPDLIVWLLNDFNLFRYLEQFIPIQKSLTESGVKGGYDPKLNIDPLYQKAFDEVKNKYGEEYLINRSMQSMSEMNRLYKKDLIIFSLGHQDHKVNNGINNFISNNPKYKYLKILPDFFTGKILSLRDNHPSKEGHKKIVDELFNYLKANNLSGCI